MSAFAKTNRIPTTAGWKYVGELTSKDHLFAMDGTPVRIRNITYHNVLAMQVRLADGRGYTCSEYARLPGQAVTHEAMKYLQVYRNRGSLPKMFHKPNPGPAAYPKRPIPAEPYLIGLMCSEKTEIRPDGIVIHDVRRMSKDQLSTHCMMQDRDLVVPFDANREKIDALDRIYHGGLEFLSKYISSEYMTNCAESREALLAGIMDVAGKPLSNYCSLKGLCTSMRMDVKALANSLGMVAIEAGPGEIRIFSNRVPTRLETLRKRISRVRPPENAEHPVIRKIECRGFARSAKIEVYGDTQGILLEDYVPVLL